ncbi:MAG TPA: nucleoside triphosphate pyrophosphohydrolase [Clostridiales bacterium]|nr:nucleoside triphosphate pyrophosphohydrolase [Clostridiales bacterium]
MKPKITIAGLGTGKEDEITLGALKALEQGERVILRTERHGIVPYLQSRGITYTTLDDTYETSETFDDLYLRMIKRIIEAAEEGDVVLGVPGHPMVGERLTFELLKELNDSAYKIEVLPGISHADSVTALVRRAGVEGLKVLSAAELPAAQLDPGLPTVIVGLDNGILASELKLMLTDIYPPELIVILTRLKEDGTSEAEEIPLHTLDHSRVFDHTSCLYLPALELGELESYRFRHLTEIMEILRAPGGCPWDREQNHESLKQYLIEETYEVLEAIDMQDMDKLAEELGDVLLQVVFHAQIAKEHGEFDIHDVISGVCRKMISRHTHIFGDVKLSTAEQVVDNWEAIKKKEKGLKSQTQVLRDIPSNLPALMRSYKVQKKAAQVGFDWDRVEDAMAKAEEEFRELKEAYYSGTEEDIREEIGDLLFAVVNVCRFLKQEPELALTAATEKFIKRFAYIEENADKPLEEMTLEEMDYLWNRSKEVFRSKSGV